MHRDGPGTQRRSVHDPFWEVARRWWRLLRRLTLANVLFGDLFDRNGLQLGRWARILRRLLRNSLLVERNVVHVTGWRTSGASFDQFRCLLGAATLRWKFHVVRLPDGHCNVRLRVRRVDDLLWLRLAIVLGSRSRRRTLRWRSCGRVEQRSRWAVLRLWKRQAEIVI